MAMTQTGKTVTQFVTQIGTEKAPNRQRFDENRLKMMEVVGSPRLHHFPVWVLHSQALCFELSCSKMEVCGQFQFLGRRHSPEDFHLFGMHVAR